MEEEEEEKRDTWKPRCVYFSAKPRQMGHFATRRRGFEKRGGGERERRRERKEKFHGENRSGKAGTKRRGRGEGRRGRWKKAAKHFFLLKFARASRAKRVFHPEPLSFRSSVSSLF